MNKTKIIALFFAAAILVLSLFAKKAEAKVKCWSTYGYGEECLKTGDVDVEKRVSLPRKNNEGNYDFRDNLSPNEDERYQKNQIVAFEIRVKNIGDATISEITVVDKYPAYIDFPKDDSNWNDSTSEYRYVIKDLEVGEEDIRTIEGRVITDAAVELVNTVTAKPNEGDGDVDTAKFYAGTRILGISTMAPTGINPLVGLIALALTGTGIVLRKRQ